MIRCVGLEFSYPNGPPVLTEIELELPAAGRVALLGTSGSGKSTLALCLAALLQPTAGAVWLDGVSGAGDRRVLAAKVGLLFQQPESQMLTRCVADEIALPLENLGWARGDIRQRVASVLTGLGLIPLATRDPHTLSGGEMQRVALAAALAPEPRYLFLDEPGAHLDLETQRELEAWLASQAVGEAGLRLEVSPLPPPAGLEIDSLVLEAGRLVHRGPAVPAALRARLAGHDPATATTAGQVVASGGGWPWQPRFPGTALRAVGLEIGHGGRCLANELDLELVPGTLTTLTGPSGSGKSTLLMALAGLLEPQSGRVEAGGALRQRVTYLPQFPERIFWRATVRAELASFVPVGESATGTAACPPEDDDRRLLAAVGLPSAAIDRSPFRLSGGERRRLALAGALRCRRPVLLLDEPAAGLDGPGLETLHRLLQQLTAAGGAVLLVAHDRRVLDWGERVLELRDGRLE